MLYQQNWVALPQIVRGTLKTHFGIRVSGSANVENGQFGSRIISDGSTDTDLAVVTVEGLQEFTGSSEKDFDALLAIASDMIVNPKPIVVAEMVEQMVKEVKEIKKLAEDAKVGATKKVKKAKK